MATKKKSPKSETPTVRVERGQRLPAVDVKAGALYYRLPKRFRTPEGSERGTYLPIRSQALVTVQDDWWQNVPRKLADTHLTGVFAGRPMTESAGTMNRWVTVRGIGSPSKWTPQQHQAWSAYEKALAQSVTAAEKDWHKEIDRLLKKDQAAAATRKAAERAAAAAERERRRVQHEAERVKAAEEARTQEWNRLVAKHGEEGAALRQGLASPSRSPVIQAHRRKMEKEAAERQAHEDRRFSVLEIDPELPKPQAARARLAEKLRMDFARAITSAERRRILPRLRRAEAALQRDVLRRLSPEARATWGEHEADSALRGRMQALEIDSPSQVVQPSPSRTPRTSPSRVSPRDSRSIAERISSPRGRYVSPAAALPTLPPEVVESIDAAARARAESQVGSMPTFGSGFPDIGTVRAWRQRFDNAYAQAKQELWSEATARAAEESGPAPELGDRFGLLEID